ncbi:hypothetical protein HanHA300_Chr09g0305001 [Helianthus annuus]|nr:hypothetical protein HanHA300_Chr09g0305001 [Helianthus annuus]KAJ0891753.1 hypothetical protein HanPSC8_Chr09g0357781 [Helianthus annuus]
MEVEPEVPEVKVDSNVTAFSDLYECGVLARVKGFEELSNLRRFLRSMSNFHVEIKYVGGLYVLLVFNNDDEKNRFIADGESWKICFDLVDSWRGQSIVLERIAWLKVHGVPLCISSKSLFDEIAGKFGRVIQSAQFAEDDGDLSYAIVGVLINSLDRVNSKCKLSWKASTLFALVEEERGEWIPDCLVELDEVDEGFAQLDDNNSGEDLIQRENNNVDNLMDGSAFNQQGLRNNIEAGKVNDSNGVFQKHFNEGNNISGGRKKKVKVGMKKQVVRKSRSPLDQERPKKRIREDDIFDVDRFIFPDYSSPVEKSTQEVSSDEKTAVFLTPDLNKETSIGGMGQCVVRPDAIDKESDVVLKAQGNDFTVWREQ